MVETVLFGDLLRRFRLRAGLPQEAVADRAGLSLGAVQSLEQGKRRAPYRHTVRALAEALKLAEDEAATLQDVAARARVRRNDTPAFFPVTLTHFIERTDVDELVALLGDRRLITLTGSGGIGKTRVAIEVARRSVREHDLVAFVDLLPVRAGELVAAQIAARLSVGVSGSEGLAEVVDRLRSRRALLVIDNCEHVVREAASAVTTILNLSSATVLATSREPLGLTGELTYRLPSMDLESATRLFVARVQDADLAWMADGPRLSVVAAICRELDGIPLAIELAASRVHTLGLDGVRAHLSRGLALSGGLELALRHRTMHGAIAWSHDLLDSVERKVFRRLSAFAGAFTLDAAQDVASDETLTAADVPEQLARLVQKSLVDVIHIDTATRYRFLDIIRAFADERLTESGERNAVLAKLAARFDERASRLKDDTAATTIVSHNDDLDEVGTIVRNRLASGDEGALEQAARLFIGYRRPWHASGRIAELGLLGRAILKRLRDETHPELVGTMIHTIRQTIDPAEFFALAPRAVTLLERTGHPRFAAALRVDLAYEQCMRGEVDAARDLLEQASTILEEPGALQSHAGKWVASVGAYLNVLLGELAAARRLLDRLYCEPDHPGAIDELLLRGWIAAAEGDVTTACELALKARSLIDRYPCSEREPLMVCGELVRYWLALDDLDAAAEAAHAAMEAVVVAQEPGRLTEIVHIVWRVVIVAARLGNVELAARLFGCAETVHLRERGCLPVWPAAGEYPKARAIVNDLLPRERCQALVALGASHNLLDLIEEFVSYSAAPTSAESSA